MALTMTRIPASEMVDPLRVLHGDALEQLRTLPDESVHCCVTSPPYWGLRDYGVPGQIGLEPTPAEYVARMVEVFGEVRRVLRGDGTLWMNLGDSYIHGTGRDRMPTTIAGPAVPAGWSNRAQPQRIRGAWDLGAKQMLGMPWRVAFALQAAGWWLRSDIIWAKPNPMPESVTDRPTKSHEYVFLLAKAERYYYDADAIAEPISTDPRENYPARARILGRGQQSFNGPGAREGDRDKERRLPSQAVRQQGTQAGIGARRSRGHERINERRGRRVDSLAGRRMRPQRSIGLDDHHAALLRCALRHLPRGTGAPLHYGRLPGRRHRARPIRRLRHHRRRRDQARPPRRPDRAVRRVREADPEALHDHARDGPVRMTPPELVREQAQAIERER